MQKNTAGKWTVFAFEDEGGTNPGEPVTGDAANITANVHIDGAAANAVDDTNPTELSAGYYVFDVTAAETNGDQLTLIPASSTANVNVIGVPGVVYTTPANFPAMGIESDGHVHGDVKEWLGTAVTISSTTAKPEVDAASIHDDATAASNAEEYFSDGNGSSAVLYVPRFMVKPASGTLVYSWRCHVTGPDGAMKDADSAPTINSLTNQAGTDLSSRLNSTTATKLAAGVYEWEYTSTSTDDVETIEIEAFATLNSNVRSLYAHSLVEVVVGDGSALTEAGGDGDHLTAVPWNAAWDAEVQSEVTDALNAYDPPTKAELDSGFAAQNDLSAAEVNAEVLDVLNTDTFGEPGQETPAATTTLADKISYIYKAWRNKKDNDGSTTQLYADDASTVDQKQTTSESGGTVTKGEWTSGP